MSNEELAQRAIACKGWRWMPGMLAQTPEGTRVGRVVERLRTGGVRLAGGGDVGWRCVPDLTDDLTRLGLITLVQEAHPECRIDLCLDMARVIRSGGEAGNITDGWLPTAEALVAALEAAP